PLSSPREVRGVPFQNVVGLAHTPPLLANLKRLFNAGAVGRSVLPNTVIDSVPVSIIHNLTRAGSTRRYARVDLLLGHIEHKDRGCEFQIAGNLIGEFIDPSITGQDASNVRYLS